MKIVKQKLNQVYRPQIFGLGEIYEIASVEKRRKMLLREYPSGYLYLSSNKNHQGRGATLKELANFVSKISYQKIIMKGYVDSPPWISKPKDEKSKSSYLKYPTVVFFAKMFFPLMVNLEFIWQGEKRSHMVYVFAVKKGPHG